MKPGETSYQKTVLPNGVRIVTERIPFVHSVSTGIWILVGSRFERKEENGISHFIEHMLFKGTERRSALDIAREIESVGGILNASTGKEYTNLYAKVLDTDATLASDLLTDIFLNSLFEIEDIEKERGVVLNEIRLSEDTPDEYVQDLFSQSYFGHHPLGYPILGNYETISSLHRKEVFSFFQREYCQPQRILIAAAGNVDHLQIVDLFGDSFSRLPGRDEKPPSTSFNPVSNLFLYPKRLEQVHLCIGTRALPQDHPLRYPSYVLNVVLGGGMSSRLFQEVREKNGLAYAIYSYLSSYFDTGLLTVYLGVEKLVIKEVVELVVRELRKLKEDSINPTELEEAKNQLRGNMLLSSESVDSHLFRLARNEMYLQRFFSTEEVIESIEKISEDDIREIAREILSSNRLSLAALGPLDGADLSVDLLEL